jgi:hypothetical protein
VTFEMHVALGGQAAMAVDLVQLVAQVVSELAPIAPWLVKVGEGAAGEAGSRLGGGAADGVRRIWARLRPAVEADQRATTAMLELAAAPANEDLQAQLRVQLGRLLADDQELAASLARLMADRRHSAIGPVTGIVHEGDMYGGSQIGVVLGDLHQGRPPGPRR